VQGTSTSDVCSEFQESNDQCQMQQGLEQVVKQGASPTHRSHGSGRGKLKPQRARRTGSIMSQRSTSRIIEPSRAKTRRTKVHREGSRRFRKNTAPS
jgi:hypothetical protein